ncbi:glycosyltransferase [Neobacillus terrae]|uniref:glycosyltransferase n=1 Tax=Neobacillus terrae TaxID=3034837 RepID=UPI001408DA77|nr:glycosyltransferase [Neobacillus terrae]NHM29960.1 glycosyltransferase [Neobacillus terrae]
MLTSIIILTYNKLDFTKQCIESIRKHTAKEDYELIIVDNHSTDETIEWLHTQENIKCVFNEDNVGFPKGCNQGIEIAKGNNILLLNNDVIVTKGWLTNLVKALYSNPLVGAVGPVTNSAAYYSTIGVSYNSLDGMHEFAEKFNQPDSSKWETRLKLIGFCMLIKKEAVDTIGMLDEQFSPGNFEDDDYSIRLRKAGYSLLLCKDTFIHHYGSVSWRENANEYSHILSNNEQKFMDKWGTNLQSYIIHFDLIDQLEFFEDQNLNILHIGCNSGGTLLELKNRFKNADLYGLESNTFEAQEAQSFAKVVSGNIELSINDYDDQFFDIIIVSKWEQIEYPEQLIKKINNKLKDNAVFLTSMFNISNYKIIYNILAGNNPVSVKCFSLQEIQNIFKEKGFLYKIDEISNSTSHPENQQLINNLCIISSNNRRNQFETYKYIVRANKSNSEMIQAITNLNENLQLEKSTFYINNQSPDKVISFIKSYYENSIEVLNTIAIINFQKEIHESIFPYLLAAYEIDSTHKDTIYNLAFILNAYEQNELAKSYLEPYISQDQEILELYNKIMNDLIVSRRELTFLVRRLENKIDFIDTRELLVSKIKSNVITENNILNIIENDIVNKEDVLNQIASICYENTLNDLVLPLLNYAFEINSNNDDTLFNLGYVLMSIGENDLALDYLNKINNKDKDVIAIIEEILGAIVNER